jgi:hypothetical protein
MDDSVGELFWTQSESRGASTPELRLEVWCASGRAEVVIRTAHIHGFASQGFDFEHSAVRLRLGDAPVREVRGRLFDRGRALALPDGRGVVGAMLAADGEELRLEAPTTFRGRLFGRFSLEGFEELVARHGGACPVD